jgi:alkylation response protein AidB-like acyl-CoA dehydrogenase
MEMTFTPEQEAFRAEVRQFFQTSVPPETRQALMDGRPLTREQTIEWQRILNAKGWAVPHWKPEWGGCEWSPVQHVIFQEEMHAAPAPQSHPFNTTMIGPVLIQFGTPEQKERFVKRAANLDDWWCQGFSEPNAGSDLASLSTFAQRDGEIYIVNGQKIWTSYAQYADWIFCLVRTDREAKKQKGISFLLIDMTTPGITVRPIPTIDGRHTLNEVFFDDVRVPVSNLVGQENAGWDCAKFLLGNERTGIAKVGQTKARLRDIKRLATETADGDRPLIENPRFLDKLTSVEIELKALEVTQMRILSDSASPGPVDANAFPSILKIKGSELQQAVLELYVDVAGPAAAERSAGPDFANEPLWALTALQNHYYGLATTIYGGTNEIQKTILSKSMGL